MGDREPKALRSATKQVMMKQDSQEIEILDDVAENSPEGGT
jgi:hypothetical protein